MVRMARHILTYAVIAGLGALTAVIGAGAHRSYGWVGLALCLLLVATASVFSRAWRGLAGLIAMAVPWTALTLILALEGPAGSVLIAQDALGLTWTYGGAAIIAVVAALPGRILVGDTKVRHGGEGS